MAEEIETGAKAMPMAWAAPCHLEAGEDCKDIAYWDGNDCHARQAQGIDDDEIAHLSVQRTRLPGKHEDAVSYETADHTQAGGGDHGGQERHEECENSNRASQMTVAAIPPRPKSGWDCDRARL